MRIGPIVLACLASAAASAAADFSLPFGSGPGAVGFATSATHPHALGIPLPMGPSSLRAERGRLYLLDGLNRRLLVLSADGRVSGAVAIPPPEGAVASSLAWLGDFALQRDAQGKVRTVWVVDHLDQSVLAVDAAGHIVRKLGGADDPASPLRDPRRIEVGASGRVYVQDEGLRQIVVFSPSGARERAIQTRTRGFFLDAHEVVHHLDWDRTSGRLSLLRDVPPGTEGTAAPQSLPLVVPAMPELWCALESGTLVLTHTGADPDHGSPQLAWCSSDGSRQGTLDWTAPEGMVRPLALAGGEAVYRARGKVGRAPSGELSIGIQELESNPEG